ncbi:SGNH/GDSL hydrolase family protein [Reyranella soli]|uniref:SGNH/GDSL hydrolase family protein n=1 Tax=Reyranella soli TaxID=1230389 RepID=UPI0011BD7FD3|nr:GDSL-type esterase/lipase family protein [Reyranella soli]
MNMPRAQRPSSRSEWFRRTVLVLCAILMGLVSLEFAVRASTWGYLFAYPNFVLTARSVLAERDAGRYVHDRELGHVPRAGYAAPGTTIEADGLRRTSSEKGGEQVAGAPILAVGDSFTYGDEVNDGQTWPAQLQQLTGRRVLNAGVSGYGFDQIVLRAEQLAAGYKPAVIVVSFIADDIRRTEMRRLWSADKPYFVIEDGKLALRGVPVPPRADPASTLTFWQRTLGYSHLFDFILRRLDLLHDWYGDHKRVLAPGTGEYLSCLLAARLAELQKQSGAKVIVMAEYDPVVWDDPAFAATQRRMTKGLLDCAAKNGLATIDSFDALAATGAPRKLYVTWHMNEPGNRLIAGLVAEKLR